MIKKSSEQIHVCKTSQNPMQRQLQVKGLVLT